MKRTLAAITTGILALGFAVVGVTGSASATGSDSPVPYTVTASSLTLPGSDQFSVRLHNDGNVKYIPSAQYVAGESFTSHAASWTITNVNFHVEQNAGYGAGMIGKNVLPFSPDASDGAFKSTLPASGYCIVWVQVDGYNEHFGEGGQTPVCSTVAAKLAAAATTTIAATCSVGQTLDLSAVSHASFGAVSYTPVTGAGVGDRTYSVTAIAASGYTFLSTGTNTLVLTGSLSGPVTTNCETPTAECVAAPTWSYTFSSGTASGVITASKADTEAGAKLCSPLYVRSATWNYNLPTNGNNPSWAQTLNGTQDVVVTTIGDPVSYAAPNVSGQCQQHDIYATFGAAGFGDLALPTTLNGPNNPYEPAFLHATLSDSGPAPTYSSDPSNGCTIITPTVSLVAGQCSWSNSLETSSKVASLTFDNSTSNVPVTFSVIGFPDYSRTVAAHDTAIVTLPPAGTGGVSYDVLANGTTTTVGVDAFSECPPTVQGCSAITDPILSTNLDPNGWMFAETLANGHVAYVPGALHVSTDGTTDVDSNNVNTDKAAGHYVPATPIPLASIGTPTLDYMNIAGSLPSIQLSIDKNGDGGSNGTLVYDSDLIGNPNGLVGSGKWWATDDLGVGTADVPNPSYQHSWGTLDDYLRMWPNARITAVGFQLGAGVHGDGMITALSAGCDNFVFDQANATTTAPAAVTFQDVCGTTNDAVFIPTPGANDNYSYATTSDTRDSTTGAGVVTVVATAAPNFAFPGGLTTMSWTHTFRDDASNNCVVLEGDPTAHNPVCAAEGTAVVSGYLAVFTTTGVTYTIHDLANGAATTSDISVTGGRTNLPAGSYSVTATANEGYTLTSAVTHFTPLVIAAAPTNCGGDLPTFAQLDPQVTGFSPVCTNGKMTSGYLQINPNDGVNYFMGSRQLTATNTPMPAGTYVVRAVVVNPSDTLNERLPNPMSVVITGLAAGCSQLKTLALGDGSLAFTGGAGPSGFLVVSAFLLLLGGALISVRIPRRARHAAE